MSELITVAFKEVAPLPVVVETRRRLLSLQGNTDAVPLYQFLVVTPLGLRDRQTILDALYERGITIKRYLSIRDWAEASIAVYPKRFDDERLRVALCFAALWRLSVLDLGAEIWILADPGMFSRLVLAKNAIRCLVGSLNFQVTLPGIDLPVPLRLQALHVPDLEALQSEFAILQHFCTSDLPVI